MAKDIQALAADLETAKEESAALQLELDAVRAELEEVKASGDTKAQEETRIADTHPAPSGDAGPVG
jgi:regulator of replication initiation timing